MVCKSWFGRHCCNYTQVSPHHLISAFPMGYSANFSDFPTQKLFLALKFPAWYICTSLLSYSHLDNNSVCFSCGVPAHFTTTVQHLSPEWKDIYIPQVTLLLSIPRCFVIKVIQCILGHGHGCLTIRRVRMQVSAKNNHTWGMNTDFPALL